MKKKGIKMDWNPKNELDDNFFEVAKKAYEGDQYWIPENISSVRKQFSESNDYFKSCKAWVGIEADKARLAGFYNPAIEVEGKKVAFFGFWESIDELDPNIKLFSDFLKWAKTKNVDKVYGPINFSTYGPYRIKTNYREGEGCFQGEPYSPPYYMKLMDGLGFDVAKRFYSQESSFKYLD